MMFEQAACADHDPELFFPHHTDEATAEAAMAVCRRCPIWRRCLKYAQTHHIDHGIWGGFTPEQRKGVLL